MKQNLITEVVQGMLPYLNNAQTEKLQEVLAHALFGYEVAKTDKDEDVSEQNLVGLFLSAKRIEGCSEKSLKDGFLAQAQPLALHGGGHHRLRFGGNGSAPLPCGSP